MSNIVTGLTYANKTSSYVGKGAGILKSVTKQKIKNDLINTLSRISDLIQHRDAAINELTDYYQNGGLNTINNAIRKVRKLAEELVHLNKSINITNVVSGSVGVTGGALAIGGILAAPFTFGTSMALTAGGVALGVGGGTATATASIVEVSKTKSICEKAQEALNNSTEAFRKMFSQYDDIIDICKDLDEQVEQLCQWNDEEILAVASAAVNGTAVTTKGVSYAIATSRIAARLIRTGELGVTSGKLATSFFNNGAKLSSRALGVVLTAVAIALDIVSIVDSAKKLSDGSNSESSKKLFEIANELETENTSISKLISELQNAKEKEEEF